ncbi:MAG: transglutaminase domain-containing protein [Porcipelethomonas sp.]
MKKFTVTFMTLLVFTAVSVLGCFTVSAEGQEQTASISMEEYLELAGTESAASDYTISSNENSPLFYDQLDSNNKAAYNAMKAWLEPSTDPVTITLPSPVTYEASSTDMSGWSDDQLQEFWSLVMDTIRGGETALTFDYPELFWYDRKTISISISYSTSYSFKKKMYTLTVNKVIATPAVKDAYTDVSTAAEYEALLEQMINDFDVEGSDYYTKVKYIHDYIAGNVTYSLTAPYCDTALGVFIDPYQILCEGYSKAVKLLCDKEGIPCVLVVGNVNTTTNMAHMWNYIQMEDGKWYGLDCTWDDLDSDSNPIKYSYFLKGSSTFLATHTPDDTYITPFFTYPELSETDYVYASSSPEITTAVTTTVTVSSTTSASVSETVPSSPAETASTVQTTQATTTQTTTAQTTQTTTVQTTTAQTTQSTTVQTTTAQTTQSTTTQSTSVSSTSQVTVTTAVSATDITVTVLKGDFNGNGVIEISDAVLLRKKLLKMDDIKAEDFEYELNGDGKLDVFDFILLMRTLNSMQL